MWEAIRKYLPKLTESQPVKRTMKIKNAAKSDQLLADFLRSKCHPVLFPLRNNAKIALYPLGIVIVKNIQILTWITISTTEM